MSLGTKYPLPLPVSSNPNEANPIVLPLCEPRGLSVRGVSVGLVVRLASRETARTDRSGNGKTFGFPLDGEGW